jgi:hypothetical protein
MHALLDGLPAWYSRTPLIRRPLTKLWRLHWRMQRATLASVVVVVRSNDGAVLVLRDASGALQLPRKQLDGWVPIPDQAQDCLNGHLAQSAAISLLAVEGTCSDVTFLYEASIDRPPTLSQAARWLEPDLAALSLRDDEARLLRLCLGENGQRGVP